MTATSDEHARVRAWLEKAPFDNIVRQAAQPNFSYQAWFDEGAALPNSVNVLIELLQREDLAHPSGIGMRTAYALGWIGDQRPSGIDALLRILKSKDTALRAEGAAALGRLAKGDPRVPRVLEALLKDPSEDVNVRANACISLGRLKAPSSKALLQETLKDRDPFLASSAKEALRLFNEP